MIAVWNLAAGRKRPLCNESKWDEGNPIKLKFTQKTERRSVPALVMDCCNYVKVTEARSEG